MLYIGIDLGTSGCRALAIDSERTLCAQAVVALPPPHREGPRVEQAPHVWWQAVVHVLAQLTQHIDPQQVHAIAVDGTSATLVLCDAQGQPLCPGLLYNDSRAVAEAQLIQQVAIEPTGAQGPSATLAKLLWCHRRQLTRSLRYVLHQADWIAAQLSGQYGFSDINNCLKLGYDSIHHRWPNWLEQLGLPLAAFPQVVTPGACLGYLKPQLSKQFGFPADTHIVAGTTDSTAAFLATGAEESGEAMTCLGSTLVLKVIADQPIFEPTYGVYSQPLLNKWLVGGASNSGGAVLLKYFSPARLQAMTPLLTPDSVTGLNYYPLSSPGERFPIHDVNLTPRLTPRPTDDIQFFQGLLEGIAGIEQQGYALLHQLGAPHPTRIYTAGGGASNAAWTQIRQAKLGIPLCNPLQQQAAYGTALLAQRHCLK